MSMRSSATVYLTLVLVAACGSALGRAPVALMPRDAACPPIGVETDTAGVAGLYYTEGRVTKKVTTIYETQRRGLAPGLELRSVRGPKHPGVDGEALVAFVVDTSGRADLASFTVEKSTAPEITKAVRDYLPSQRFAPATLGGCVVRQLVFMPFVFSGRGS
jgi:hypothetical protein